jgi:hypothetical protein
MRFRVKNIHKGYCEVWANESDGQMYQRLACVMRDKSTGGAGYVWVWSAKHNEPPFYMPFFTHEFGTRREAVIDCERWALKRLVELAIERQPKESWHWHSPRRDAFFDVERSYLFTDEEMEEIAKMLMTFEEEQHVND